MQRSWVSGGVAVLCLSATGCLQIAAGVLAAAGGSGGSSGGGPPPAGAPSAPPPPPPPPPPTSPPPGGGPSGGGGPGALSVVTATSLDRDGDGRVDAMRLVLDRPVRDASIDPRGFAVAPQTAASPVEAFARRCHGVDTSAAVDDAEVLLLLPECDEPDTGPQLLTFDGRRLEALDSEPLGPFQVLTEDGAAPVIVAAVADGGAGARDGTDGDDRVLITFSEPVRRYPTDGSLTAPEVDAALALPSGRSWRSGDGGLAAAWLDGGRALGLDLSDGGGPPTVQTGDAITPDGATIGDEAGLRLGQPAALGGTFGAGPEVTELCPALIRAGLRVVLRGGGFGSDPAAVSVSFDGVAATVEEVAPTELVVRVPAAPTAGDLVVRVDGRDSAPVPYALGPVGIARWSGWPALAAEGRVLAFAALAPLVPEDTNGRWDVYVYERATERLVRVSVPDGGGESVGADVVPDVDVSATGERILFSSGAGDLVAGDGNGADDIFVRDRVAGATIRASLADDEAEAQGFSFRGAISADGRFVAFYSDAPNLVPGDAAGFTDVFVRDLEAGRTERVSVSSSGVEGDDDARPVVTAEFVGSAAISHDGRFVVFESAATNLVPGDTNGVSDVFVRDRLLGRTERVSLDWRGEQASRRVSAPAISDDGRWVAFVSEAALVPGVAEDGTLRVFLRDRVTGRTAAGSVDAFGRPAAGVEPSLSADGRFVAFSSTAPLLPDDGNGEPDVYVHDRRTGLVTRISLAADGSEGTPIALPPGSSPAGSVQPALSPGGCWIAFGSDSRFVPGDSESSLYLTSHGAEARRFEEANVGLEGGEVRQLAVDPLDPDVVYAATPGGVFRSANAGATWARLDGPPGAPAVVVPDPLTAGTLYAVASGTPFASANGGATWSSIDPEPDQERFYATLAVAPASGDLLLAYVGFVRVSGDGGRTWGPFRATGLTEVRGVVADPADPDILYAYGEGLARSVDRGVTWTVLDPSLRTFDLAVDPSAPAVLYLATSDQGVLKSSDRGDTLVPSNGGVVPGRLFALAIDPADPATVFAGGPGGALFVTTDGGGTWTAASAGLARYTSVVTLAAAPTASTTLLAGQAEGAGVRRSTDGGGSWSAANAGLTAVAVVGLAVAPSAPDTLYATAWGGFFRSVDGGASWARRDAALPDPRFSGSPVVHPTDAGRVWGVTGGGLVGSGDGGQTWSSTGPVTTGSVQAVAGAPSDGDVLYVGTTLGAFRSADGGASWSPAGLEDHVVTALVVAPGDPLRVYAATHVERTLYRTTDGGATWTQLLPPDPARPRVPLAVDPFEPSRVLAFEAWGRGLLVSEDGGDSWRSANGGLPPGPPIPPIVTALVCDPLAPGRWWAAAPHEDVVLRRDGSACWAATAVPAPICMALDPERPQVVYVGTDSRGVFRTVGP